MNDKIVDKYLFVSESGDVLKQEYIRIAKKSLSNPKDMVKTINKMTDDEFNAFISSIEKAIGRSK